MKQKRNFKVKKEKNSIAFRLKPDIYPLETIYLACYAFLDRAYLFLDGYPQKEIIVRLKGKKDLSQKELAGLVGEFHNELLNSALRQKISRENKKLREAIVFKALASAQPQLTTAQKQVLPESYLDDPLGIAVAWEEKYGRKKSQRKSKKRK